MITIMDASTRHMSPLLMLLGMFVFLANWKAVDSFGISSIIKRDPYRYSVSSNRHRGDNMINGEKVLLLEDRKTFLASLLVVVTGAATMIGQSQPAFAGYGETSTMALPNYIEYLIEKNALANPDAFLYKGPDPKIQLQRLLDANKRLEDIPMLPSDKKWSQVQGILTGPLGTLSQTLNLIAKDSSSPDVQSKAKKVKETIFSISTAASKKDEAEVVAKTRAAGADLAAFVRAAF
jgi:hypothetical protein